MKFIVKLLLTAFAVLVLSNLLSGIVVENYVTAVIIAFVIAVLNMFVRPILVILTLPVTILTLGLFLFVINAIIILIAGNLVSGFYVNGFLTALVFSILLSIFRSFLFGLIKEEKKNQ
ncbi:phage holin family protein [Tenacibaculum sp. MEBiC06402]|uniref:phage holin family protein n=1 Tax=unclassified Tenacibaculum TaxID=2635139 RepID=UPI003B9924DE